MPMLVISSSAILSELLADNDVLRAPGGDGVFGEKAKLASQ